MSIKDKEHNVIVIGASQGGIEAIKTIFSGLPEEFSAAIFVVLHIGAYPSNLPWLLNHTVGSLPASHPKDGDPIRLGHIYIAPPDHHMGIEQDRIFLTKGPRENWTRPAIDPLFRTAARTYGPDTIGVILTGGLNDGTAGLYEIKRLGGIAIVQNPDRSINPSMPRSALANVSVDYCLPVEEMSRLLLDLVAAKTSGNNAVHSEQVIINRKEEEMEAEFTQNRPVAITCPDCGGALRQNKLGTLMQYRCHIGHVYTAEVMLAAQFVAMEHSVEAAMRSLNERAELCRQMAEKPRPEDMTLKNKWEEAMNEAFNQAESLRQLLQHEWIHPDEAASEQSEFKYSHTNNY